MFGVNGFSVEDEVKNEMGSAVGLKLMDEWVTRESRIETRIRCCDLKERIEEIELVLQIMDGIEGEAEMLVMQ
ncbi:hypothetical protein C5167_011381 [Papaver somniferum]|uniref:Uncharacterized protein n=1 Tax=Papaver somniferum TaxID=3469 RepID=A0A4Y7K2V1_PAPSO|nr:hypothetical protein C5167_011381 [Papaver somniferum]